METSKKICVGVWSADEYSDVNHCHFHITPERVDMIKKMQQVVLDNKDLGIYCVSKFDDYDHEFLDTENNAIRVDFYMLVVNDCSFWIRSNEKHCSNQIGCDSIPINILDNIFDNDQDVINFNFDENFDG